MRLLLAACVAASGLADAAAETFTSADVAKRSLQRSCLDWKVVGVCLWLHCKYGRCRINATPRVRHHLPDLVFVAYDHTGAPPWRELAAMLPDLPFLQGGSFPTTAVRDSHALRFKEVDAIGHPFPMRRRMFEAGYLCRSQAKPMFPYFVSVLDHAEWRGGLEAARVESVTPGLREIGAWPRNSWGAVFPRTGFVQQAEDAKAAAVAVQRAADIVTQQHQARVYVPFAYDGPREVRHGDAGAQDCQTCEESGGLWQPDAAAAAAPCSAQGRGRCRIQVQMAWLPPINERNARWQMITPKTQTHCETFGTLSDWSFDKTSKDGGYAWNLWRPYECCKPGRGRYLGHRNL